ncbi:MAG: TonB C-terminal domain-containing protein [Leptolyngbya sp.]|nr:TonB C-terminal domain-containing protein [Candidatus Melainabacteria bacterium]
MKMHLATAWFISALNLVAYPSQSYGQGSPPTGTREAAEAYLLPLKTTLNKTWHPAEHYGVRFTQIRMTLDASGKISKREVLRASESESETKSVSETLDTINYSYPPLPANMRSLDVVWTFMSSKSLNSVSARFPAFEKPANPAGSSVPPTVTSSTQDIYGTYMASLQNKLRQAWLPPLGKENMKVSVLFHISKSGAVSGLVVTRPSGAPDADLAALNAVRTAAPFGALPEGAKDPTPIQFTFFR